MGELITNFLKLNNMINYKKLMGHNPTELGIMMNDLGQQIHFYEHPLRGDEASVIAVSHELELAEYTDFFELDDMTAEHGEYQPFFIGEQLHIGDLEQAKAIIKKGL